MRSVILRYNSDGLIGGCAELRFVSIWMTHSFQLRFNKLIVLGWAHPTLMGLATWPMVQCVVCLWREWLCAWRNVQIQADMFFCWWKLLCGAFLYD